MSWGKVDDRLHRHRKARKAKLEAMGLWVMALSFSTDNRTDGRLDADDIKAICEGDWRLARRARDRLIEVGLWESLEDGGAVFHDWAEYQPTSSEVAGRTAKATAAAHARWNAPSNAPSIASSNANRMLRARIPSRPVPVPSDLQPQTPSGGSAAAQPGKPEAKKGSRAKSPESIPGFAAVVACYVDAFEAARGVKPPFQGRDGNAVKALLLAFGGSVERVCDAIRAAYAPGAWTRDKATLASIAADPAKCLGQGSLGASRSTLQHAVAGEAPGWVSAPELVFERGDA